MVSHWRSAIVLLGIAAVATAQNFANTDICQPVFDNNNQNDGATGFVRFDVSAGAVPFFVNDIEFVADTTGTFNVTDLAIFDGSVFLREGQIPSERTILIDANNVITLQVRAGDPFRLNLRSSFEVAADSTVGIQVRFANNQLSNNPFLVRFSSVDNTQLALNNPDIFNGDTIRQWGSLMVSVGQAYVDNVLVDNVVFHGGVCVTNLEQNVFVSQEALTAEEVVPPLPLEPEILGSANASIIFDDSSFLIRFVVEFRDLSSNPTEIGLFNPALRGESVGQISQFAILPSELAGIGTEGVVRSVDGEAVRGLDAYRLNPTQRDQLFEDGLWYIQINTENNPMGELRAQIEMFEPSTTTYSFPLTVDAVEIGLDGDFEEELLLTQRGIIVSGAPVDIPAPNAQATAQISFMSGSDDINENAVDYNIQFSGLTGEVTNAFFTYAALNTETADFFIPLMGDIVNDPAALGSGSIVGMQNRLSSTPDKPEIPTALDGMWYLTLNTEANPEGEVRAQVNRGTATDISSAGSGFATVTVDAAELTVRFQVEYEALSSSVIGVEIRGPVEDGANGDPERGTSFEVVVMTSSTSVLGDGSRGVASGVSDELSVSEIAALTSGQFYVIVLTEANPLTGELRGTVVADNIDQIQVGPTQAFQVLNIPLTVEAEINALDENLVEDSLLFSNASGMATVSYTPQNGISWDIQFSDLAGLGDLVAAHFHGPAGPTETGPVRVDLLVNGVLDPELGTLQGSALISDEFAREALAGLWYVNLHGIENPLTGEIRGQVVPIGGNPPAPVQQPPQVLTAMQTNLIPLTRQASINAGVDIQGPEDGAANIGSAMVTLYPNNTISWEIGYMGPLSSDVTLIHFHGPAGPDETAGVQVTVYGGEPEVNTNPNIGQAQLPDPAEVLRDDLLNGMWYVNIHTELNPMGELRGQVVGFQNVAIDVNQGVENVITPPTIEIDEEDNAASSNAASVLVLIASAVAASISVC